jgi:uncharacterized protein (TIGR02646 family)
MIRIRKPRKPPSKLTTEGKNKAAEHIAEYAANPTDYQSGHKKISFAANIYNDRTVKTALVEAQHKKCCFCERLIGNDGDVEHFRPKSAYTQQSGDPLKRPGYYWLAYNWDNLYLSCAPCNQRQKGNLFPLVDPTQRAHVCDNNIMVETPMFIDPGRENPAKYISFRGEIVYSVRGNSKGKTTIESLGLDRDILNDVRLRHLQIRKKLYDLVQLAASRLDDHDLQLLAQRADQELKKAALDSAEYAAVTRQAIEDKFQGILDS